MKPVTIDDRKKELGVLLNRIRNRPSHDWSQERQRIVILQQMISGHRETARA